MVVFPFLRSFRTPAILYWEVPTRTVLLQLTPGPFVSFNKKEEMIATADPEARHAGQQDRSRRVSCRIYQLPRVLVLTYESG
jgi:hypothetical protein